MTSPRVTLPGGHLRPHLRISRYARLGYSVLAGILLLSLPRPVRCQTGSADEFEIRAAMLINLTKFIEWPVWKMDSAHPQLVICILGSDSIGPIAERYAQNQIVSGKPLQVRTISSVDAAASCNLLYIGVGQQKHVHPAVNELAKNGVLTVSESSNSTLPDQVIGLPTLNDQVHIEINLGAAQRSGLTISSKLLRLSMVSQ